MRGTWAVSTGTAEAADATPLGYEANRRRTKDDDRERDREEKDADEGRRGQRDRRAAPECALADALHRLKDDRQHSRFETEKQRDHDRHLAPGRVDVTQRHDGDDAG